MVAEQTCRDVDNLTVHPYFLSGVFGLEVLPTGGVRAGGAFGEEPFMFCEAGVVIGVDDCEFALGEGDSAERAAEAETAIQKDKQNKWPYQPVWDVKRNLDNPLRSVSR